MLWAIIPLQWLHILIAIFWFGSLLTLNLALVPALKIMQFDAQKSWLTAFEEKYGRIVAAAGGLTIVLGTLRGIVGGVLGELRTAYGVTFIASVVLTIGIAVIGARLTGPMFSKLSGAMSREEVAALLPRASRYARIELAAFLVVFTLMIAMRFGL